ncbi:hypothetical protein BC831DRAFT_454417 [Entophlyctis helioformis]|nr:hypothetical protein BC831DRAFT_454417 [Entophlyctis helioformis]
MFSGATPRPARSAAAGTGTGTGTSASTGTSTGPTAGTGAAAPAAPATAGPSLRSGRRDLAPGTPTPKTPAARPTLRSSLHQQMHLQTHQYPASEPRQRRSLYPSASLAHHAQTPGPKHAASAASAAGPSPFMGTPGASTRSGASRAQTPAAALLASQALAAGSSSASTASAVIDDGRVLLHSRTHQAIVVGDIPLEAIDYIRACGLENAGTHAVVDQASGHAAIATPDCIFVWSYLRNTSFSMQCTQFPIPSAAGSHQHALIAFVPQTTGGSRQPGLIACTADGSVRYWENVAFPPDSFRSLKINLANPGDFMTVLVSCEPLGFALGTDQSVVFRISLFDANGASQLSYSALQRSSGVVSRVVTSLFRIGQRDADSSHTISGNIVCLIPGRILDGRNSRELHVLSAQMLQKWVVSRTQPDRLVSEVDIQSMLAKFLRDESSLPSLPTIRIEDADYTRDGRIAVLVGYSELAVNFNYSVLVLQEQPNGQPPLINNPRGTLGLTQNVLISTIEEDVDFEESLPFRSANGRIIGLGVEDAQTAAASVTANDADAPASALVAFLSSDHGLVQVNIHSSVIRADARARTDDASAAPPTELAAERATQNLKTKLEQAVFYGGNSSDWSNPISFDIAQTGGNLDAVALEVSSTILDSSNSHVQPILDLGAHLAERALRMNRVLACIEHHGLLDQASFAMPILASTRLQLSFNAERITAAEGLWRFIDTVRGDHEAARENKAILLLETSVDRFMTGQLSQADPIKDFFETKLQKLDIFLAFVADRVRNLQFNLASQETVLEVFEINRIFLIALSSAAEYRANNADRYGIRNAALAEPWTAAPGCTSIHHEATLRLLQGSAIAMYSSFEDDEMQADVFDLVSLSQDELKSSMSLQLCQLVDILLGTYRRTPLMLLKEQYMNVLPKVIESLVPLGRASRAFYIAEKYREFPILVTLCLADDNKDSRIRQYMSDYGIEFSQILFDAYHKRGMLRDLVEQNERYYGHLEHYFATAHVPELAWIHAVGTGDFGVASDNLWGVFEQSTRRDKSALALSLSKLAALEASDNLDAFEVSGFVEKIDRQVERLAFHASVERALAEGMDVHSDVEAQTSQIMATKFTRVSKKMTVVAQIVRKAVHELLSKALLLAPELVETLTAVDAGVEGDELFSSAIDVVAPFLGGKRAESDWTREHLEFFLHTIWRRAWLNSSWSDITAMFRRASVEQVRLVLKRTVAYQLIKRMLVNDTPVCNLAPQDVHFIAEPAKLRIMYQDLDEQQVQQLYAEHAGQQKEFERVLAEFELGKVFDECVRLAYEELELEAARYAGDGDDGDDVDMAGMMQQ